MEEITERQRALINEVKRLSKNANQRILQIERLTKRKSPQFAVKELADLLSSVNGLTKRKGKSIRVAQYKKSMTETQLIAIDKALRNFLNKEKTPTGTIRGIKEYTKKVSIEQNKKLSFVQAAAIYRARSEWKNIFDYVNESEFWSYYNTTFRDVRGGTTSFETFYSDMFTLWRDSENPLNPDINKMDKDTLNLLHNVYDYITKGS
jgi:hypothetical protein